jgi:serine/threonine protein kinase/tetratricopeptide (TPR) repeat protein
MAAPSRSLKELFLAALDVAPAGRAAWLQRECAADAGLGEHLRLMLAAHDAPQSLLDRPVGPPAASSPREVVSPKIDQSMAEGPGSVIGPYKLLEPIGEGGFGVVFLAEQSEPVRRRVALKLLKPGMDSRQVIARFEAERQALAIMDHPNIAKVFDGGVTPPAYAGGSQRPYLVMELVRGVPVTEYCDQNQIPVRQRLELFASVCQAVQHAHQKGVIHRDLKPSNVLVSRHDTTPVVKVIDFGVAKALSQALTDKTLFTGVGQMVGTPLYMSPEQAGMSDLDVDTRSDIYSLGVLLYELLTGTTPFEKERLKHAGYDEIRRIIREEEPARPSTRISTLGPAAATVSANRQSDPKKLGRLVRGELDWVVLKALEKDRNRRYETASAFARDVERYLADEPVLACPPSAGYRVRKFVRRNRGPVLAGALLVLALVAGLIGTSIGLRQANAARKEAEGETALANAVKAFLKDDVLRLADPATQQQDGGLAYDADVKLRDVVLRAAERIEGKFADRPLVEAELRNTLGFTLLQMGRADRAVRQCERARELYTQLLGPDHPDTLRSINGLASSYRHLGQLTDALKLYEETLMLQKQKLGPVHPDTLGSMNNLADSYMNLGRHADAVKLHEETLTLRKQELGPYHPDTLGTMNSLAASYLYLGRHADAVKLWEETLTLGKQKLGSDHPETLRSMHNLATGYDDGEGRHADALKLREEALPLMRAKLGPDHPRTLSGMHNLANSYMNLGRYADGVKLHEETLTLKKLKHDPSTLSSMFNLAECYLTVGRHADALKLCEETLTLYKQKAGPTHVDTVMSMNNLGDVYAAVGRQAEALKLREETLTLQRQHFGPDHPRTLLAMSNLALSYADLGRHAEALKLHEQTLMLRKQKLGPDHPDTLASMHNLARSYMAAGRHADALKLHEETLTLRKQKLGPDHPDTLLSAGEVISSLAALKRPGEALPRIDALLALADQATQAGKHVDPELAPRMLLCRLRIHQDRHDAAACRATAALWEQRKPADASSMYRAACAWALTAAAQARQPAADAARRATADADQAMAWLARAVAAGYADGASLGKDRDFDSLRPREDFKKLLTGLQARKK